MASKPSTKKSGPGSSPGLSLLVGAGASVPLGIPDVFGFVKLFGDQLEKGNPRHLKTFRDLNEAWDRSGINAALDLERLYELLSWIEGEEIEPPIPLNLTAGFPERSRETEGLLWELKRLIQSRCLEFGSLKPIAPLVDLVRELAPVTILTLNYDTCLEALFDSTKLRWSDGFPQKTPKAVPWSLPDFSTDTLAEATAAQLLKLHGSASWYQVSPGWMQRGAGMTPSGIGLTLGGARTMTGEAMMVYPTLNKALADGPFPSLLAAAQQSLARSKVCLAIGYAFGDIHIRRLLFGALATNPDLRLVLVNPAAESVRDSLLRDRGADAYAERIGFPSLEMGKKGLLRGFIQNALAEGWLLERARAWLAGEPIAIPQPSPTPPSHSGKNRPWTLRLGVREGVSGLARRNGTLVFVERASKRVRSLHLEKGATETLSTEFFNPRGLAWDALTERLYVVENVYRVGRGHASLAISSRGLGRNGAAGMGRLWELRKDGIWAKPVTGLELSSYFRAPKLVLRKGLGQIGRGELWRELKGCLRWPLAVTIDRPGESLFLTEATQLSHLDLTSGALTQPLSIPLCTNLCGVVRVDENTLWLIDAGLYPRGLGRWLEGDLRTGLVRILASGWPLLHGIAYLPARGLALLALGGPRHEGRVLALDPSDPTAAPVLQWQNLDDPSTLCVSEEETSVFAATREGIIELSL